ncbi:MAG: FAD-dependent oxidoreductase [Chloroflexi bacterium]|nr:FAD-dependent oxidoreductase [Chloroflexota bacterium]
MYDLIILGAGPAGLAAAAYAINKRLETLVISEDLGGKINYHLTLAGFEGHEIITGADVVEKFKRQLEYLNFAHQIDRATKLVANNRHMTVLTQAGKKFDARAVIIATGASPQRIEVPGEKRLIGRGLSYSSVSHAQLFIDREAALFGCSGRALRSAAELAEIAKRVHLILPDRGEMDSVLGQKLRAHPRVTLYENYELREVRGEDYVESVVVRGKGETSEIPVQGLFVELGLIPNSQLAADLVLTNAAGKIVVDSKCATSRPGIFAAGDVTDVFVEQVLISVGEGAKAALSAYEYLLNQ